MNRLIDLTIPIVALIIFLTPFVTYLLNVRNIIGDLEMFIIDLAIIGVGGFYINIKMKNHGRK